MDAVTAIADLARESICAILTLVLVWVLYRHDRSSHEHRSEIERMVREILHIQNGKRE
jgi:hypothetical protein